MTIPTVKHDGKVVSIKNESLETQMKNLTKMLEKLKI